MKRFARFKVIGRLDRSQLQSGTITIDRAAGLLSVRPARRHREYTLPLSTVAEILVSKIIRSEVAAARAAKRAKRGGLRLVGGA